MSKKITKLQYSFENELGHEITIMIDSNIPPEDEASPIYKGKIKYTPVFIAITGPASMSTNVLTILEAEMLRDILTEAIRGKIK
jgi:hypothetical protein